MKTLLSSCMMLFLLSMAVGAAAQQRAQYSQYMLNPFVLNPAVAGLEDYIDLRTSYRAQWVGLEGGPQTGYLAGHMALNKTDQTSTVRVPDSRGRVAPLRRRNTYQPVAGHHGVGALLHYDRTGPTSRTSLLASYARHQPLTGTLKLAFGLSGGVTQHMLDFDQLELLDPTDPIAQQGRVTTWLPEVNAGLLLYDERFYAGLSAHQFAFRNLGYGPIEALGLTGSGRLYPHFFASAGYRLPLTEDLTLVPSLLLKYMRPAPLSFDVNARMLWQERFWAGLSYRHHDALVGLVGVNISSQLNVGYSYDFTFSNLKTVSRGTHEIVIGLMLNNRQQILCPRLF